MKMRKLRRSIAKHRPDRLDEIDDEELEELKQIEKEIEEERAYDQLLYERFPSTLPRLWVD